MPDRPDSQKPPRHAAHRGRSADQAPSDPDARHRFDSKAIADEIVRHATTVANQQRLNKAADADRVQITTEQERAEGIPADESHRETEPVQIQQGTSETRLMLARAIMAALVAGLGALAAGVQGADSITLGIGLTAAASAAAAAGAVYGVQPEMKPLDTRISTADLATMRQRRDTPSQNDTPPSGRRSK